MSRKSKSDDKTVKLKNHRARSRHQAFAGCAEGQNKVSKTCCRGDPR